MTTSNELGRFLRNHREATPPDAVGLPNGLRRRTPGLRRAELATLAGVSVDYLTRLEQGRDRNPSPQVLGALADAVGLSPDERLHLKRVAALTAGGGLCPASEQPPARTVRPAVQALLMRLEPAPAVVLNRISDLLAYTTGYVTLAQPLGILEADVPNLARYQFTHPQARVAYPDWDTVADEQVARLQPGTARLDPPVAELADELTITAGAAFSDRWTAPSRPPKRTGVERIVHPEVGQLHLAYECLELADADGQLLVVYLADDEATSAALDHLTGREPGALRAVSG
jgi:transcriptional regulator with XRE-family HTH domain